MCIWWEIHLFSHQWNNKNLWYESVSRTPLAETNDGYSRVMIFKWKASNGLFVYRQHPSLSIMRSRAFIVETGLNRNPFVSCAKAFLCTWLLISSVQRGWLFILSWDLTPLSCTDAVHMPVFSETSQLFASFPAWQQEVMSKTTWIILRSVWVACRQKTNDRNSIRVISNRSNYRRLSWANRFL